MTFHKTEGREIGENKAWWKAEIGREFFLVDVSLEEIERDGRKFRHDEIRENAPPTFPVSVPDTDPPITISCLPPLL